jgi:hypothetical protein
MKTFALAFIASLSLAGVAAGSPIVTNQDDHDYQLQLDCKHISAGQSIQPDQTITLDEFKPNSSCQLNVYPSDNPFGKDGDYDKKKLITTAKLKRDSECVIKKRKLVCE